MHSILAILLFVNYFNFDAPVRSGKAVLTISDLQTNPCPASHEKAEKELEEYLGREKNIEDLRSNYDLNIDQTASDKVYTFDDEMNKDICERIIKNNSRWLENAPNYSLYRVGENYFVVTYSLVEKGEIDRHSIVVINSEFEAVAVVIDF